MLLATLHMYCIVCCDWKLMLTHMSWIFLHVYGVNLIITIDYSSTHDVN